MLTYNPDNKVSTRVEFSDVLALASRIAAKDSLEESDIECYAVALLDEVSLPGLRNSKI